MCNPTTPRPDLELGVPSQTGEFSEMRPLVESSPPSKCGCGRDAPSPRERCRNPNADAGLGSALLDSVPPPQQMALIAFLMFLFFGAHNVLQEAIANLLSASEGLESGGTLMLGYAEVVGVLSFSCLERTLATDEGGWSRVAPLRAYPLLTACLFASSSMSNLSLSYINFPTKVVFRSCKLVPTMIIATVVNQRVFRSYEYVCALSICAGLILFALADYSLDPLQFEPTGILLVSGSVVADAMLPNAQEHLFRGGSSRLEVTVYSNLFSFLGMTALTLGDGTLPRFLRAVCTDSTLALYFAVYTVLSYVSISCYMTLVKRFGGVTAVVLTTARKAMTLALSFLLFPKGFSWLHVHGSLLVLGAVMVASIRKRMGDDAGRRQEPAVPPASVKREKMSSVCRSNDRGAGDGSQRMEVTSFAGTISGDSHLEKDAEDILERISNRGYV